MSDEAPVVPIRPGAQIRAERSVQLAEFVAEQLASFPHDNDGEEPESIAFVIIGNKGTSRARFLVETRWRANVALASLALGHLATGEE